MLNYSTQRYRQCRLSRPWLFNRNMKTKSWLWPENQAVSLIYGPWGKTKYKLSSSIFAKTPSSNWTETYKFAWTAHKRLTLIFIARSNLNIILNNLSTQISAPKSMCQCICGLILAAEAPSFRCFPQKSSVNLFNPFQFKLAQSTLGANNVQQELSSQHTYRERLLMIWPRAE